MMDVMDDDSILSVLGSVRIHDLFNFSCTSRRFKNLADTQLKAQTKLLIYKKSPITDWAADSKCRGESNIHSSDPLHSIILDVSKRPKDFATLLDKLPNLVSVTFGVYTTFTKGVIEVINGKLSPKVTAMSFYFPFGLHGKRIAQLNMENLTKLRVRYAGLTEPDLKLILSQCPKLEYLDVTGNWYISGQCFGSSALKLKTLQISRCSGINYEGVVGLVEGAGKFLDSLEIDFLGSSDKIEPEFYLICASLINLKSFKFRTSSFGGRDPSYIRWLTNLTSLTVIELGPMMTDEALISILRSCSLITHLHLDACYARGLITDKSVRQIPDLLPRLSTLRIRQVKTLTRDSFSNYPSLGNLYKVQIERCGSIPVYVLSECSQVVDLLVDPCSDVASFFRDSAQVAKENPRKVFTIKALSSEEFKVDQDLPRNLKFTFTKVFKE